MDSFVFGWALAGIAVCPAALVAVWDDPSVPTVTIVILIYLLLCSIAVVVQSYLTRRYVAVSALEAQVNKLWGRSMFDWVVGRSIRESGDVKNPEDHVWFFYCGEEDQGNRKKWKHKGYGVSLVDVLIAMIELGQKELEEKEASDDTLPS